MGTVWRKGGVALSVLAPPPGPDGLAAADPVLSDNDNSLVVRIDFGGRRVLFTGDVEADGEADLVAARGPSGALRADVVKVPHHGSPTSSSPALVRAVHPRVAVISCGPLNRFHFPSPEVVARWRAAGARVLRTDHDGSVTVTIAPDGAMTARPRGPPPGEAPPRE